MSTQENQLPTHIEYAKEISRSAIPILEQEFNLECIGDGGSMPQKITTLSINFIAKRRANLEEARALQIKCTEKLLQIINGNEKSRSYLSEYPFTFKNINISISFENYYGQYADGTIAFTCQGPNHLAYFKEDPINARHIRFFEEPYSEALKIIQKSDLSSNDLCCHKTQPYENELDKFLDEFARECKKKWGINRSEAGGDMVNGIREFAFLFTKNKRTSIEEARKIEVGANTLLISKINANEKLRPYLMKYPFPIEKTKIKILFRESDSEDFDNGSLHSVFQENNKIQYHAYEPEKENQPTRFHPTLIKEELYDEAVKLLTLKKL